MTHTIEAFTLELQYNSLEALLLQKFSIIEGLVYSDTPFEELEFDIFDDLIYRGTNDFPSSPFFPAMRAYPYILKGEWSEAERLIDMATEKGEHFILYSLRGLLCEKLNHLEEAEKHYLYAAKNYPDIPLIRYALAGLYLNQERFEEAFLQMMHYTRLSTFSPESVELLIGFFQHLTSVPFNMYVYMYRSIVVLLNFRPTCSHTNALYASICGVRYNELVSLTEQGEDVEEELFFFWDNMVKYKLLSAVYDRNNENGNKDGFKEFFRETVVPQRYFWYSIPYITRYHFLNTIQRIKFMFD